MNKSVGASFTANGDIITNETYGHPRYGEKRVEINLSEIYTVLIQEAGRWCESYASDLLVDIDILKRHLDNPDSWRDSKNFKVDSNGNESIYFKFGFRAGGVDHKEYIEASLKNDYSKYYYYRSMWELTVTKDAKRNYNRIRAELKRIA